MFKGKDITGQKFNYLTAIKLAYIKNNHQHWLFKCDCGNKKIIDKYEVTRERTTSCSCKMGNYKHSYYGTKTYNSWLCMKTRCLNKNSPKYSIYGGRGIKICERWKKDFKNFLKDMGERPDNKTLDRINNNGNYEPSNCRWATHKEQANNRRPRYGF